MRLLVAVVGVLAACGDGVGAPDATLPPDADVGLVRVRFRGDVLAQHDVFFQNADGSLVLATRTGVDGTANAYMAPGGYVTLVDISASTHHISTWAQVQPGDELVLNGVSPGADPTTTFAISIPIDPGAGFYGLQTSCGAQNVSAAAGTSLVIELGDCRGRADMFVFTAGAGFHYLYGEDVPVKNGGMVTLPPPYSRMERSTVEVRNAPATTSFMEIKQRLIGEGHSLFEPFQSGFGYGTLQVVDGAGSINFDMPLPPAGTMLTEVSPSDGFGLGRQYVARWGRTSATTTVDLAAIALRRYVTPPRYDAPTHSITWTEEATGTVASAVLASWTFYRPEIGGNYQWQIFAPRGADPVVRLPVLPDPQYLPREHDVIVQPYPLVNIAIDGGYERIRAKLLGSWAAGKTWPAEGPSGDVVYQELAAGSGVE